jgi:hypothetical protein
MPRDYFICHSCGERVECRVKQRPCEVLDGWLMVSLWSGPEAVEHYNFCSLNCLKTWVDTQLPKVPDAFLRAFEKGRE